MKSIQIQSREKVPSLTHHPSTKNQIKKNIEDEIIEDASWGVKLPHPNPLFDEKILELMHGLYYDNVNVYI